MNQLLSQLDDKQQLLNMRPDEQLSKVDEKTLQLMYTEIKERQKTQQESVKDLEKKANSIIGFVGVITGLGTTWFESSIKEQVFNLLKTPQALGVSVIYIIGIVFFLLSITCAFLAYKVEGYRVDPNPQKLAENYFFHPYRKLLEQLIDNFADSFNNNEEVIRRKAKYVNLALLSFILGIFTFFVFVVTFLTLSH